LQRNRFNLVPAESYRAAAENGPSLVEHGRQTQGMDEKPGPANCPGYARHGVQPTPPRRHRVLAIDVAARRLKQRGIGMKGTIDQAMTMLSSERDKIGEQHGAIG